MSDETSDHIRRREQLMAWHSLARQSEQSAKELMLETELHEAAMRLIDATEGANTLGEVGRLRGASWTRLLAEESGVDHETVLRVTSKPFPVAPRERRGRDM
jgi:hypothetical protein